MTFWNKEKYRERERDGETNKNKNKNLIEKLNERTKCYFFFNFWFDCQSNEMINYYNYTMQTNHCCVKSITNDTCRQRWFDLFGWDLRKQMDFHGKYRKCGQKINKNRKIPANNPIQNQNMPKTKPNICNILTVETYGQRSELKCLIWFDLVFGQFFAGNISICSF